MMFSQVDSSRSRRIKMGPLVLYWYEYLGFRWGLSLFDRIIYDSGHALAVQGYWANRNGR